jgi:hypothetical protein
MSLWRSTPWALWSRDEERCDAAAGELAGVAIVGQRQAPDRGQPDRVNQTRKEFGERLGVHHRGCPFGDRHFNLRCDMGSPERNHRATLNGQVRQDGFRFGLEKPCQQGVVADDSQHCDESSQGALLKTAEPSNRGLDFRHPAADIAHDRGLDQVLLPGEAPVDGHPPEVGAVGNVVDAGAANPEEDELLGGSVENALSGGVDRAGGGHESGARRVHLDAMTRRASCLRLTVLCPTIGPMTARST